MQQLEEAEPMHIFIKGGGGVGKTCLGHALMETITRYYRKQVGENYERKVILTVNWLHFRVREQQHTVDFIFL